MDERFSFYCPHCGKQLGCTVCGRPWESSKVARNALAAGTKYCTGCGKEIASILAETLTIAGS